MRVYPVAGRFLFGVPHVEHDCEDPFCVESGAFSVTPPDTITSDAERPDADGDSDNDDSMR